MIETTQTVQVRASIDDIWDHVHNIRNWADLMPGLQTCDITSDDDSRWVLKVGVGALVRTVSVDVHVDSWNGPEAAHFSFRLKGDPVAGTGSYRATAVDGSRTAISLSLRVEGTGPMAPMWEAMGAPLLPKFALAFARQLAEGIEESITHVIRTEPQRRTALTRICDALRRLWRLRTASKAVNRP